MSNEQWEYFRLAVFAAAVAACFWYLSRQPEDRRSFRIASMVLSSWFLSTRWTAEPRNRLRLIAALAALLAVVMLIGLATSPHAH
jgi:hypothetical protein